MKNYQSNTKPEDHVAPPPEKDLIIVKMAEEPTKCPNPLTSSPVNVENIVII